MLFLSGVVSAAPTDEDSLVTRVLSLHPTCLRLQSCPPPYLTGLLAGRIAVTTSGLVLPPALNTCLQRSDPET